MVLDLHPVRKPVPTGKIILIEGCRIWISPSHIFPEGCCHPALEEDMVDVFLQMITYFATGIHIKSFGV